MDNDSKLIFEKYINVYNGRLVIPSNKIYHASPVSPRIILNQGLLPKSSLNDDYDEPIYQPAISFMISLKYCYAYIANWKKSNLYIYMVNTSNLPKNIKFYKDESVPNAIFTYTKIPSRFITLLDVKISSLKDILRYEPNAKKMNNDMCRWRNYVKTT